MDKQLRSAFKKQYVVIAMWRHGPFKHDGEILNGTMIADDDNNVFPNQTVQNPGRVGFDGWSPRDHKVYI